MSKDDAAHSAEGDKLIADDGGAAMMGEVKAAGVLTVVTGDTARRSRSVPLGASPNL